MSEALHETGCWCCTFEGEGPLPNVLQEARVDILTEKECRMFWGKIISDVHICLGDRTAARKAACNVSEATLLERSSSIASSRA